MTVGFDRPIRLYLVRHGSTLYNEEGRYQGWSDPPLSRRGEDETVRVAQKLAPVPLQAVYSSDLQRAAATARRIVAAQAEPKPPLQLSSALREINMGLWEGLTYGEIERRWAPLVRAWYDHPERVTPPEGETFAAFRARVVDFLRPVAETQWRDAVVFVAHGGVIRLICALLGDVPFEHMWRVSAAPGEFRVVTVERSEMLRLLEEHDLQTD